MQPVLRHRDPDGNVFSETTNSFGRSETTSLLTASPSTSTQPTPPDVSQSEPESSSARSASEAASDSDAEEKEEEVVSHLQRLQGLAGSWRRHNKRPRLGREYREAGAEHHEEGDVAEADAMQVYVHGINETGLRAALEKSSLWHKIELNNNLEVGMLCFACSAKQQCFLCLISVRPLVQPLAETPCCAEDMCCLPFAK